MSYPLFLYGLLPKAAYGLLPEIAILIAMLAAFGIAAELITRGTEKFEGMLGQGVAGGVILGFMSALPETIFVIIATSNGDYSVAISTAIGGNVLLFTLGLGIISLAYWSKWRSSIALKEDYKFDLAFLIFSTFTLLLLIVYGKLNAVSGSLLSLIYIVYVAYRLWQVRSSFAIHISSKNSRKAMLEAIGLMTIGIILIVALSKYFIADIVDVAGLLSIPAIWLSLVITPIAADIEELLGAYKLAKSSKGGGSTAIVSFLGGKLENNTILVGIIGIMATAPVALATLIPEFASVIIINAVAISMLIRGRFSNWQGLVLVLLYFAVISSALLL
ncbi:MAG: hypothetical protein QXF01_01975 [Candidatus Micrarchaeaceae archaeon]